MSTKPDPASELELIQWEHRATRDGFYRLGHLAEVDSTNSLALRHLANLRHGDVLFADWQREGRGRSSRTWVSPAGNLYLSLVLKPDQPGLEAVTWATASYFLCHVVCCVLDQYKVRGEIKWPNDVLVNRQKIAGILAESVFQGSKAIGLVLGLGANLRMTESDLARINQPATSLDLLIGHKTSVREFLERLLSELQPRLEPFLRTGFPALRQAYLERCEFLGKTISVRSGQENVTGQVLTVNADGALEMLLESGMRRVIHAGEMEVAQ